MKNYEDVLIDCIELDNLTAEQKEKNSSRFKKMVIDFEKENCEINKHVFDYFLCVLPPVAMNKQAWEMAKHKEPVKACFVFVEGLSCLKRFFYKEDSRYFCKPIKNEAAK